MVPRALWIILLAGCVTADIPAPDVPPADAPMLQGFSSGCPWQASSSEGWCSRTLTPVDELSHAILMPHIAIDPMDPDRIAVVVTQHARDAGYATTSIPLGPEAHWLPWLSLSEDGGRTWTSSIVPVLDLYYGQHPGGDPHASEPYALFDSTGTLHVLASVAGGGAPLAPASPGMVHAMSEDGATWSGGPVHAERVLRVAYAWEEGGAIYALLDHAWREDAARPWSTPMDAVGWRPMDGPSCRMAVHANERWPRIDLDAWTDVACPANARTHRVVNATLQPGPHVDAACDAAFIVPLARGELSLGNAGVGNCGSGLAQVDGSTTTLQEFFHRPDDEEPPLVMGLIGDGHGNAIALAGAYPEVMGGLHVWMAALDAMGKQVALAQVTDGGLGVENGQCGMAMGDVLWVACVAPSGDLDLFRFALAYA